MPERDRLGSIAELPDKHTVQVRRELFTQLDIDDKYVDDDEKPPFSQRVKTKCTCTRSKLFEILVYVLPIIAVLKNYEFKKFVLGIYRPRSIASDLST